MFYPQSNFHSQSIGYPQSQGIGYPYAQSLGYPQGLGYPQSFGYPQGSFGQQGFPGTSNIIPLANTLSGYPQLTPSFAAGVPQSSSQSSWQIPAQQLAQLQLAQQQLAQLQLAQQQAALQQQAMLHLLATQSAQPFTQQHLQGSNAFAGMANGASQSTGVWQQPQAGAEQINPALLAQSQQQFLQRLAQYHHLVAQQLAQLAAQQATQGSANPYAGQFLPGQFAGQFGPGSGQFMPNQLGTNFVPGITMH